MQKQNKTQNENLINCNIIDRHRNDPTVKPNEQKQAVEKMEGEDDDDEEELIFEFRQSNLMKFAEQSKSKVNEQKQDGDDHDENQYGDLIIANKSSVPHLIRAFEKQILAERRHRLSIVHEMQRIRTNESRKRQVLRAKLTAAVRQRETQRATMDELDREMVAAQKQCRILERETEHALAYAQDERQAAIDANDRRREVEAKLCEMFPQYEEAISAAEIAEDRARRLAAERNASVAEAEMRSQQAITAEIGQKMAESKIAELEGEIKKIKSTNTNREYELVRKHAERMRVMEQRIDEERRAKLAAFEVSRNAEKRYESEVENVQLEMRTKQCEIETKLECALARIATQRAELERLEARCVAEQAAARDAARDARVARLEIDWWRQQYHSIAQKEQKAKIETPTPLSSPVPDLSSTTNIKLTG